MVVCAGRNGKVVIYNAAKPSPWDTVAPLAKARGGPKAQIHTLCYFSNYESTKGAGRAAPGLLRWP